MALRFPPELVIAEAKRRQGLKKANGDLWINNPKTRPDQLPPKWDWLIWLILAGRGWGKTRTGAETLLQAVREGKKHIAIIAPTYADARDVCVEGPAGVLACDIEGLVETWNRSLGEIRFKGGARAKLFAAEEPDRLRGPQHDFIWGDEPGAWAKSQETYDMARMGLRLGSKPQMVLTTTPRAGNNLLRQLLKLEGNTVHVTRGKTRDNKDNLAPGTVEELEARYAGTRLGRQELEGEVLDEVDGALWQRSWFEVEGFRQEPAFRNVNGQVKFFPPAKMDKIVVALDPSVTDPEKRKNPFKDPDACGIAVVGRDTNGNGYVLGNFTEVLAPSDWARLAVKLYDMTGANEIVAEQNQGGELIAEVIRSVASGISVRLVSASVGKRPRAEPVVLLYEQGRARHCGRMDSLEDRMTTWDASNPAEKSPNDIDAVVWGFHGVGLCRVTGKAPTVTRIKFKGQNVREVDEDDSEFEWTQGEDD